MNKIICNLIDNSVPRVRHLLKYVPLTILIVLGTVSVSVWVPIVKKASPRLTVTFLNVGQGDAIFITTPSGKHILVDGGSGTAVLHELGSVMSLGDRRINMIVATHPDKDHITGLISVVERYRVGTALVSGVIHTSSVEQALERALRKRVRRTIVARRGQVFDFGDGVRLHVLFPDRAVPHVATNTGSVVLALTYGTTTFVLTGDSPQMVERYLAWADNGLLAGDVLKAGHHGSKTSSDPLFVGTVHPTDVIFSRGCNNPYGHPHQSTVDTMHRFGSTIFDTCLDGRIVFVSDGSTVSSR